MGYVVDLYTEQHEYQHGCIGADCEIAIALSAHVVAAELVSTMRRNPFAVYCRRRGCGHLASVHESAGCTAEGCDCEELRE